MRDPVDWPTRDLLAARTEATPARRGLVDAETSREWTFTELDALVERAARRFDDLPEDGTDRVGLLASTRVGFAVAVHAVLRTGRSVVPFNLALTDEELDGQIERAAPDAVVCEAATESRARSLFGGPTFSLDEPQVGGVTRLQSEGPSTGDPLGVTWSREEEAVVMFTSGTTGKAKGVTLTLGNLVASATASAFRLGVSPDDRWLCCLPAYHMGGLAPILRTALYGTTLVVQPSFDATETAEVIESAGVTGVSLVPTMLYRLLEGGWEPPEHLDTVLLGGAPARPALLERALRRDVPVYPTYGMTETASQMTTATPEQARGCPETVGRPLVFTDVTVVDDGGAPVESGETGEIVVDGPTVTPGYLDDERTAAAFGEEGLSTGDIGTWDENGLLRVLGRADDSIVTGGETVHPAEVATALRSHEGVDDAAVVGVPDEEWGERVAAVVVSESLTAADVRADARTRLASYEVPKTVEFAAEIPRTASGTVDREAVRDLLE
jgi:O-succinylbenzoic acid--CoA ligase